MFNIFVLAVYNIWFFKKDIFKNTDKKFKYECIILINRIFINITWILYQYYFNYTIIIMYVLYMLKVIKIIMKKIVIIQHMYQNPIIKIYYCSLVLIVLSILLTFQADKITHIYPKVSSSTVGAILTWYNNISSRSSFNLCIN